MSGIIMWCQIIITLISRKNILYRIIFSLIKKLFFLGMEKDLEKFFTMTFYDSLSQNMEMKEETNYYRINARKKSNVRLKMVEEFFLKFVKNLNNF